MTGKHDAFTGTTAKKRKVRVAEAAYIVVSDLIRIRCGQSALSGALIGDERMITVHRLLNEMADDLADRMGT